MTTAHRHQYTSVRTRIADDGKPVVGLKHTAKGADGAQVKHDWVEMPAEDVPGLIKTLQDTLEELCQAGYELGNG